MKTPIPGPPRPPDNELRAAKIGKFFKKLTADTRGKASGFVVILLDAGSGGPVVCSSLDSSRDTAAVLRRMADKVDGKDSDA
jgi:hypothetical protein